MDFKDILKDMVLRVDGGKAAVVMGFDGIPLEEYKKDGVETDIQIVGIEYAGIIKDMKHAAEILDGGQLAELSVVTSTGIIVVRCVNDDYFLMINLAFDGNLGKARYMLKMAAPKLKELL